MRKPGQPKALPCSLSVTDGPGFSTLFLRIRGQELANKILASDGFSGMLGTNESVSPRAASLPRACLPFVICCAKPRRFPSNL